MAFRSFQVQVTDTPVQVIEAQPGDVDLWVLLDPATVLGGDDQVAVGNAFSPSGLWYTQIRPGDELWAVRDSAATSSIHVMVRSA